MPSGNNDSGLPGEPSVLAAGVREGKRRALARAITLVESTHPDHRAAADALLTELMPHSGRSMRLGISGPPGVGKSTFIEALGNLAIEKGRRVAVLTVDPSSAISGGSILGDKTRMETLARRSEAFIRPSPAGKTLGGVARRSREALIVCEAAGFDLIIVETVGVGQSETMVADMTDMFVVLLQPGGGDELQGIKRGIMEMADLLLINKADGGMRTIADDSAARYRNALQYIRPRSESWRVEVRTCSALENSGVEEAWESMLRHQEAIKASGELENRRARQSRSWMWAEINDSLLSALRNDPAAATEIEALEQAVGEGRVPANIAARRILERFLDRR